jgi:hypothetical protein
LPYFQAADAVMPRDLRTRDGRGVTCRFHEALASLTRFGRVTARLFECTFILVGIVAVLGIVTLLRDSAQATPPPEHHLCVLAVCPSTDARQERRRKHGDGRLADPLLDHDRGLRLIRQQK